HGGAARATLGASLPELYRWLLAAEYAAAIATVAAVALGNAPYGRHSRPGGGPTLPARVGWGLIESPGGLVFVLVYWHGAHRWDPAPLTLLGLWLLHYLHRTFVFPLRMRGAGRRLPVLVVALAVGFNLLNGYLNATWISALGAYPAGWLTGPRFLVG